MEKYQVKEGDTIVSIAQKFEVRVLDLIDQNELREVTYLEPGSILEIPINRNRLLDFYKVQENETLESVAQKYSCPVSTLAKMNGKGETEFLYPNETILVPKPGTEVYFTEEDDTVTSVARYFNTTEGNLQQVNPHLYLMAGQMIVYYR